jgi:glycosyltransferase involved in cell wall biosynthesis
MKPLVSIGVPVYNNAAHIRKTLSSLVRQSYPNIEIIVSDDASTDGTLHIAKRFAERHSNVRVFEQKHRLGTPGNFNFTLSKASGKYFMWAAGDDFRDVNCLSTLVPLLENNKNCTLAVSRMDIFNTDKKIRITLFLPDYSNPEYSVRTLLSNPEAVALFVLGLYRRCILLEVGGYHRDHRPVFQGASDLITSLNVMLKGKLAYTDHTVLHKRDSGFYLTKYDILRSGNLPRVFSRRILRYFLFPIMFTFDLYHTVSSLSASSLTLRPKAVLYAYALRLYVTHHIRFASTIYKGIIVFLQGRIA